MDIELQKAFDGSVARSESLGLQVISGSIDEFAGEAGYARTKRVMDIALAALFMFCSCPLFFIIWALAMLDGGPPLYAHQRVGRWNRSFPCLKFRTMRVNSDDLLVKLLSQSEDARIEWNDTRKLRKDPRVTRVGLFLRVTSLDELPQLINVLRGEMSLVGPRPVVEEELDKYYVGEFRSAYLSVRPGLTGLWQVSGRSSTGFDQRVMLDMEYIRKLSWKLDLNILARTFVAVVMRRGAI